MAAFFQRALIALLIQLLVFPPWLAAASTQASWLGGTDNYSDYAKWVCGAQQVGCGTFPNNVSPGGPFYDVTINSGGGDTVNYDISGSGAIINSLNLGGSGAANSSTFNTGNNSITLGTGSVTSGNVLTVSNGGILNVQNSGNVTLDLTGGANMATTTGGAINVLDGGTLNLSAGAQGASIFNAGAINLSSSGSATGLNLNDNGNANAFFVLAGGGTLSLSDNANNFIQGVAGTETLLVGQNGGNISGAGLISNFGQLTNNGNLTATGSNALVLDVTSTTLVNSGTGSGVTNNGTMSVSDGGTLTIRNTTSGANTQVQNGGNIALNGAASLTSLVFDDGGTGGTFTLVNSGPTATLTLSDSANNVISGPGLTTTLVNGAGHTIQGAGTVSVANFTNNGTLSATGANPLIVSSHLTNWDGASTLTGGTYSVGNGSTLQLSSIASAPIQTLQNANVNINGSGLFTGNGASNAISNLTNITDSNVNFSGVTGLQISPLNSPATLTISSDNAATPASLTLDAGSNIQVNGGLTNLSTDNQNTSTLNVQNGSTLTVTGALLNQSNVSNNIQQNGSANINVTGGSTLNVDSLTTSTNNGFATSTITVDNSNLNVTNSLLQGGDSGGNISSGADQLNIQNGSTVVVGGDLQNNNGLNSSAINVNASNLTVDGSFSQTNGGGGFGSSSLNLTNGSTVVIGGNFTNFNGTNNGTPQSTVSVAGGSTLSINGTFNNVDSFGTLSGGGYSVSSGSSLNYTGADIQTIDYNTVLSLDNANGTTTGTIKNNGHDALSNSLNTVHGTLNLGFGATLNLDVSSTQSFTNNGSVNVTGGSGLTLTSNSGATIFNAGALTLGSDADGSSGSLILNDNGNGQTFLLTGSGTVAMSNNAGNSISGGSGLESLINDVGHTISGAGSISNFVNFTNNGTLHANYSGGTLLVASNLTNWDGGSTLTGGTYIADAGATLQLSSVQNQIRSLHNANVTIGGDPVLGNGLITGDGVTNALGSLSAITADDTTSGPFNASFNLNGANLTLANDLGNTATASSTSNTVTAVLGLSNGGILNVNNLSNIANNNSNSGSTNAQINLTGASSLTVNGDLSNIATNSSFGSSSATISLGGGSSLQVNGSMFQTNDGSSSVSTTLDASTMNVTGNFTNTGSSLYLYNTSTATIGGLLTNDSSSLINLDGTGNQLSAKGGLTNYGTINVGTGDVADFRNNGTGQLTTLAGGTLTSGTYNLNGQLFYDTGADSSTYIQGLNGANISVAGTGGIFFGTGAGTNALGRLGSLTNGSSLSVSNQTLAINPNGSNGVLALTSSSLSLFNQATVNVAGAVSIDGGSSITLSGGGNTLTGTGLTNNGTISLGAGDVADFRNSGAGQLTNLTGNVLTGGTYNLTGQLFYDTGSDTSTYIQGMNAAIINLSNAGGTNAPGAILFGSGAGTNALGQLSSMTDSTLGLSGQNFSINPNGSSAAFTLTNGQLNLNSSNLTIEGSVVMNNNGSFANSNINLTGSNLTVDGSITNNAGSFGGQNINLNVNNGIGSVLTATGALINYGNINLNGGGNQFFANGLTNNGTVNVTGGDTADFRNGGTAQFTNLTGSVLTGGTYNLAGSMFYDQGTDGTQLIQSVNNATLNLSGAGALLYGSGGGTDALSQLGALTNSTLTLNGQTRTFNPGGSNGTFTMNGSNLNLNALNSTASNLTIQGGLQAAGSSISITGGSTLNVQNTADIGSASSLTIGNGSSAVFGQWNNLNGGTLAGGTYNLSGNLSYTTGADSSTFIHTLSGVNLTLNSPAQILFGPGAGTNALTQLTTLTNSSLTLSGGTLSTTPVGGTFTLDPSTLNVNGGATMTIAGAVDNAAGSTININGASTLNITGSLLNETNSQVNLNGGGNTLTAAGFTNDGSLLVLQNDVADVRGGAFTNLSGGTLTGGSYDVAGTFLFDGGNIQKLDVGTTLTLDGRGGGAGAQVLSGSGAGADTLLNLNEVAGTLNLYNGETRGFTPSGGTLTVDANAAMNLGGNFAGSGVANITGALTNNGTINLTNSGSGLSTSSSFLNTGTLNVNNSGEFVTSQGLNNQGGTIFVAGGATLDARTGGTGTFSNLDGTTGTLGGGGTFNIGGSFLFDASNGVTGGNIYSIGAGTTLDLNGGQAKVLYGPGAGTDAIAGLNEIAGALNLVNGASHTITPNGGTLTVDGTGSLNLSNGSNTLSLTGSLTNKANGTVSLSGASILNVSNDVTNAGTFTQADGNSSQVNITGNLNNSATGTYTVGYGNTTTVDLAVNNTQGGIINVNGGFNGAGGQLTAHLGVDNAGTINLNSPFSGSGGGTLTSSAPVINESTGIINVQNAATMTGPGFTNNGTLNAFAGGLADFRGGSFTNLSGGTLTGGTYVVGGTFQFDGGSGSIQNIAAGTNLTLDGQNSGLHQVLSGTTNALANLTSNSGKFTLTNGVTFNTDTTSAGGTFTNSETLTTSGNAANQFNVTGNLTNTSSGVMNLNATGDQVTATGQFTNAGALTLNGNSASVSSAGLDNQANGIITLTNDRNAITSNGATTNEGAINMNSTNGKVTSVGDFTNTGTVTTAANGSNNVVNVTGNIFNTSPGVVNLKGSGDQMTATGQFTNSGTLSVTGNNATVSSNDFSNTASGIMTLGGSNDSVSIAGVLNNAGGITIGSGDSITTSLGVTDSGNVTIDNGGKLIVQNGDDFTQTDGLTTVETGGTLQAATIDLQGGTITGGGKIAGDLTVDGGTLNPGDPQSIEITGNYDQTLAGIMDLDLASTSSFDHVTVDGNANLNGTLDLTLEAGFDAAVGSIFDIVSWHGSETGNFSTFNDVTFDNGTRTFAEVFNANGTELDLEVVGVNSATPEPSSWSLVLGAMLLGGGVTWNVRRRRAASARR